MSIRFFLFAFVFSVACDVSAKDVDVKGYTRKDGTYVRPHKRSEPDDRFDNNWSTYGNVNPHTGEHGTRRPSSNSSPLNVANPHARNRAKAKPTSKPTATRSPVPVTAGETILGKLNLGKTTLGDLRMSFPDLTYKKWGNGISVDSRPSPGVIFHGRLFEDRLCSLTLVLALDSKECLAMGGFAGMRDTCKQAFSEELVDSPGEWAGRSGKLSCNLGINRKSQQVSITLEYGELMHLSFQKPKKPKRRQNIVYDESSFHLEGFRPTWTKYITLSRGTWQITTRFLGTGNFAVWLYDDKGRREDLVANEIGRSSTSYALDVGHRRSVRFQVKHKYMERWDIDVRRVAD